MNIRDTAKVLGIAPDMLRYGLQCGMYPFGFAVKRDGTSRYTYTIIDEKLWQYIGSKRKEEWAKIQKERHKSTK